MATPIVQIGKEGQQSKDDCLAVEAPLEMRLWHGPADARESFTLAITMRTPGADLALAAGFIYGEGLIQGSEQIQKLDHCGPLAAGQPIQNVVRIELAPGVEVDPKRFNKYAPTHSACGLCGKTSLEAIQTQKAAGPIAQVGTPLPWQILAPLPQKMRAEQGVFAQTGGVHACAIFDRAGQLLVLEEDIGRHNAVDKAIGRLLLADALALEDKIMVVSGRAGFELIQKAVMADVGIFMAVGAPSDLGVELARAFEMTLLGFARPDRMNIYVDPGRIQGAFGPGGR